jgi:hypothetical protein
VNQHLGSRPKNRFEAKATFVDENGREFEIRAVLMKLNGRTGINKLTIWPNDEQNFISRRVLSDLPLYQLFHDSASANLELLAQIIQPRRVSTAHQGRAHSDKDLQRVADVYAIAYEAHRPVQKTVAAVFGISVSAAAKRIMAARNRGFISPIRTQKV